MMWLVIISLISIIIIWFNYDRRKMESQIKAEGGMRKKYEILIDFLMSGDTRTKILDEGNSHIVISLTVLGSFTIFELVNTFRTITIVYRTENVLFGKHRLEWEFPVGMNQEQMYFRINKDIGSFLKKEFNVSLND